HQRNSFLLIEPKLFQLLRKEIHASASRHVSLFQIVIDGSNNQEPGCKLCCTHLLSPTAAATLLKFPFLYIKHDESKRLRLLEMHTLHPSKHYNVLYAFEFRFWLFSVQIADLILVLLPNRMLLSS